MYNKALSLLLIFSLAFNIAFVGIWIHNRFVAEEPAPAGRPAAGPPWAGLGLRPDQQSRLQEEWRRLRTEVEARRDELEIARDRLLDLMAAEGTDEEAVRRAQARVEELQEQIRRLVLAHMRRTRDFLTPEQRRHMFRMMMGREPGHPHSVRRPPEGRNGPRRAPMMGPEGQIGPRGHHPERLHDRREAER